MELAHPPGTFLAALARDWDSPLDALKDHLDQTAPHAHRDLTPHNS